MPPSFGEVGVPEMIIFEFRKTWKQHFDPYSYSLFLAKALFLPNRLYFRQRFGPEGPPRISQKCHFLFKLNTKTCVLLAPLHASQLVTSQTLKSFQNLEVSIFYCFRSAELRPSEHIAITLVARNAKFDRVFRDFMTIFPPKCLVLK